ncbi:MAG: insulinase family protein [Prevotella sp.]|nr:insulinase family protein [Prevotella sp.]
MEYNTTTLPNGLRVIHLPAPGQPVVYCGYAIAAGTRHELPGEEGLAHFVEHTTFKGTARRSAMQILNCLESVGGDLNAFTTKEHTVYYAAVLREHVNRAVDLLTDIVFNSTYPQAELDKEKEVICDEIESYNDTPSELIYDEFENLLFRGHPLGHNILGNREQLQTYTTADALRFARRHYRPDNAVFFMYGGEPHTAKTQAHPRPLPKGGEFGMTQGLKVLSAISPSNVSKLPSPSGGAGGGFPPSRGAGQGGGFSFHQSHVMLGARTFGFDDARRMPLFLLNNILGGPGMNARLNLALRERRGLVYTVESSMTTYADTGTWAVYFGCDHEDTKRCLRLVQHELQRFVDRPLSDRQLAAAKRQLKGQLAIAADNREQFALDMARTFLHEHREHHMSHLFCQIDAVTAAQVQQVAQQLFAPDRLQTLIL